jgi:hypothetical protein
LLNLIIAACSFLFKNFYNLPTSASPEMPVMCRLTSSR